MSPAAVANDNAGGIPPEIEPYVYRGPWWKHKGIRAINLLLLLALITSSTNGYDGSMMNGLQALENWKNKFNNPQGGTKGLLNAIQNIGSLLGYPLCPYVTDHFGRRAGIFFGSVIMIVGVALQATCNQVGVFIASRGIIGFGLTFCTNAAPCLITELAYPTQRGPMSSLYNSLWYSGSIIAAWTTFGTFRIQNSMSWRIPSILQAIPSILQIGLIYFVPESPRWLVSKGKHEQARNVLARYHTDNSDTAHPLVEFEMSEITQAIKAEEENKTSWISLFQGKGNLRRLRIIVAIAFFSQWSGNGLVSYYLTDVLNSVGITSETIQTLYNGILQIFNMVIAVTAAMLCDKIGRRTLFLWSNTGMLISFIIWTICAAINHQNPENTAAGRAILGIIFLFYFSYDIAYCPLIVSYTIEITPTKIRPKMLSIFNFVVSAALVFNQYVNPIALDAINWKYYLVFVIFLAFELVYIYFFLVETKNRTLEETAALFDGEDAVAEITGHSVPHTSYGGASTPDSTEKSKEGGAQIEHLEHEKV